MDEAFSKISLQPGDAAARSKITQVVSVLDAYAYRPMVWDVFVQRVDRPRSNLPVDTVTVRRGIEESRRCLRALTLLKGGRTFLAGDHLSLADLHAYPMLLYLSLAPDGRALLDEFPALSTWLNQVGSRPSVIRTRGLYETFPEVDG